MANKKKGLKSQSNGKQAPGQSTSRMEIGHSSASKSRRKDKKRKSLKLTNGESQDLKDQLQNPQIMLLKGPESRAQTLSPEKHQLSLSKVESAAPNTKNFFEAVTSPKPQQMQLSSIAKKNSMQTNASSSISGAANAGQDQFHFTENSKTGNGLDNSLKYQKQQMLQPKDHHSQLSISSNQGSTSKNRPQTGEQQNLLTKSQGNVTSTPGHPTRQSQQANQSHQPGGNLDKQQQLQAAANQQTSGNFLVGSGGGGTRSLIPLAINAAKKFQMQQQQLQQSSLSSHNPNSNFQISVQGQSSLTQQQLNDPRYKHGFSPIKQNTNHLQQMNNSQASSYHYYKEAQQHQQLMTQELQQTLQSNIQAMSLSHQHQIKTLQQQQFQHILNNKHEIIHQQMLQYQQQRQNIANQVGINGLLNMTKQRGLNGHQQVFNSNAQAQGLSNIRNSQGFNNRSHSSSKNTQQTIAQQQQSNYLQTNGKNIMAHKSPLYNSLQGPGSSGGAHKVVQGQFIPPHNQNSVSYNQQQQACPLSIFDIQFYQSDLMVQSSKGGYPKAFPQGQSAISAIPINHSGFSLIPQRQMKYGVVPESLMNGFVVSQPTYGGIAKQRPFALQATLGQGNYYYYDQPVQVNGKQMGLPIQNAKQDRNGIKKGGSASILANSIPTQEHNSYLIHYDPQTLAQEEMIKQAILQELLDTQQVPAHMLLQNQMQSIEKQFYSSLSQQQERLPQQDQLVIPGVTKLPPGSTQVKKQSKIPFANAYVEDRYKFIVVAGNNSGLIRKALERRDWWIEIPSVHSMFNFKWQPVSYGIKFERLSPMKPKPGEIGGGTQFSSYQQSLQENGSGGDATAMNQMVNHFEFHHFISEKANLFKMMQKYCETSKESIFDLCPVTFFVEVQDLDKVQQYNQIMLPFVTFYQALEENKDRIRQMKEQLREFLAKQPLTSSVKEEDDSSDQQQSSDQPSTAATANKDKDFLSIINNKGTGNPMNSTISAGQKITKFRTFNFDKRTSVKYSFPMCHFDGYNLWLLKPTHLNRGRGIHVFRDLETFHKLIREYCQGRDEEVKVAKKDPAGAGGAAGQGSPQKDLTDPKGQNQQPYNLEESQNFEEGFVGGGGGATLAELEDAIEKGACEVQQQSIAPQTQQQAKKKSSPKKNNLAGYKIKHNTFIIQKYIEQPLLIFNRKFDIRVWVLIDQEYDLYFFKEGYLRTSSSEFSIDLSNIDNQYVHLTNNAVQKFSEHYGQFEDGNQLSFKRFQQILDLQYPDCQINVKEDLVPQMKELIIKSSYAVRKKLDPFKRKHCFELFGYDFILDQDFNVWLIEVNTNPCIEESSELLKIYLPRMIEDMLKLTIDKIFPKLKKAKGAKKPGQSSTVTSSPAKRAEAKKASHLDKIEEEATENYQSIQEIKENPPDEDAQQNSQSIKTKEEKKNSRIHPVEGYSNTESMWEKIWNLEKPEAPPNKYSNFRTEFLINVNESKQFKLKRNPLYRKVVKEMMEAHRPEDFANKDGEQQ